MEPDGKKGHEGGAEARQGLWFLCWQEESHQRVLSREKHYLACILKGPLTPLGVEQATGQGQDNSRDPGRELTAT